MRYLIQFAVPLLIIVLVSWGVSSARRRRLENDPEGDGTWAFVAILAVGAAVAIIVFLSLGDWLSPA